MSYVNVGGFTDELITGKQSSLTTENNISPLSPYLVTDLKLNLSIYL